MANYAIGVNPIILKWAREIGGFSIDEVAKSLSIKSIVIYEWENGNAVPTYNQLERLAYTLYKRPLALFFFPTPPEEIQPKQSFRTLPEPEINNLIPDTRFAIRQALSIQIAIREIALGETFSKKVIFHDIHLNSNDSVETVAGEIRKYLNISLSNQVKWKTIEQALETWRNIIQDNGIFIFKRSFKQNDISGFCLNAPDFPVIYLNNSTTKSRQIFSIFHELAHILLGTSGITKRINTYLSALSIEDKAVEIFCNQFAAEFLVPSNDFDSHIEDISDISEDTVEKLADRYKVSREVILRKFLDRNIISSSYYESKVTQWWEEYLSKRKGKKTGGDYYATQASYLGDKFLNLTFSKYYQGKFTVEQLADYLGVKVTNISGLEQLALRKGREQWATSLTQTAS